MLGIPHRGHMHRPKYYEESCSSGSEDSGRHRERLFAELLRQRQGGMFGGHHPALGGMGGYHPPFMGGHGMGVMMGGHPRHGSLMGMGPGLEMGMALGIGMHPGMGMGPGRPSFCYSPYGHSRHQPFGFGFPGPPRAHSFMPYRHHSSSPFSRASHSPFSSRMFDSAEDDFEDDYHVPSRHGLDRRTRGGYRFPSRRPSKRRGYRPGPFFEDSEDEFDEYDGWDDEFGDEDEFEGYYAKRSPYSRWRY